MAAAYLVGVLFIIGLAQGEPLHRNNDPAIIEDLRMGSGARVVAGWEAEEGQIPHQISLRMVSNSGGVSSCGGSIIHHEWVITAAHCVANRFSFVIRLGLTNLTRPEYLVETTKKFIHPEYEEIRAGVQTDDIALLGLEQSIPYGPNIQPCRLQNSGQKNLVYTGVVLTVSGYGRTDDPVNANIQPCRLQNSGQKNLVYTGVVLTVSGYGRTDDPVNGGAVSEILRWVYLRGITNQDCRGWYNNSPVIQDQTICAEYYNDTAQSSCQGDSGGPLTVVDLDGKPTMVGIVSFGSSAGCNSPFPSAYVRPGHYHDWYLEITGLNFDWSSEDLEASYKPIQQPVDVGVKV